MQYVIVPIVNETQRKLIQSVLALESMKSLKEGMPISADWLGAAANAFDKVHDGVIIGDEGIIQKETLEQLVKSVRPINLGRGVGRVPTDSEVTEAINGR